MRAVTLDSFDTAPAVRDDLPDPISGRRRACCARARVFGQPRR